MLSSNLGSEGPSSSVSLLSFPISGLATNLFDGDALRKEAALLQQNKHGVAKEDTKEVKNKEGKKEKNHDLCSDLIMVSRNRQDPPSDELKGGKAVLATLF